MAGRIARGISGQRSLARAAWQDPLARLRNVCVVTVLENACRAFGPRGPRFRGFRSRTALRVRACLRLLAATGVLTLAGLAALPARAEPLEALGRHLAEACDFAQNPWCRLPGDVRDSYISKRRALEISRNDVEALDRLWGWGGPKETFGAWGSAAFDGRKLYFYGGGHHHYRGNDIKVYDLATLGWSRLYDPAYVTEKTHPAGRKRFVPEHGPRSVHVYDGLIYDPGTNALYLWGLNTFSAWAFDLDVFAQTRDPWRAWQAFAHPEAGKRPLRFFRTARVADGRILVHGGPAGRGRGSTFVFDPKERRYWGPYDALFAITAMTAMGERVYAAGPRGDLVEYDHAGRKIRGHAMPKGFTAEGSAVHPDRGLLVMWDGGAETLTFDPASGDFTQVATAADGPLPERRKNGPWGAWQYVDGHDVFVGLAEDAEGTPAMWAYRLPDPLPSEHPLKKQRQAEGYTCSDEVVGWTCPDLQAQIDRGEVVKGVYAQCGRVDGPVAFNGAWLKGTVCQRKAALIADPGAVIENVKITDVTVGLNGNCVRWQGGTVVIRGMTCLRADMGVLGFGEALVIEDSTIADTRDTGRDHGHLVYACPRQSRGASLTITGTTLASPGREGHVLKTGCAYTRVEDSRLLGGDQDYSRLVDAFNGGVLEIRDSELTVGRDGGNGDLIGYGAEMRTRFEANRVVLTGGRLDCRRLRRRGHSLHTWDDRARPESVTWQPDEDAGCPKP